MTDLIEKVEKSLSTINEEHKAKIKEISKEETFCYSDINVTHKVSKRDTARFKNKECKVFRLTYEEIENLFKKLNIEYKEKLFSSEEIDKIILNHCFVELVEKVAKADITKAKINIAKSLESAKKANASSETFLIAMKKNNVSEKELSDFNTEIYALDNATNKKVVEKVVTFD